MDGWSKLTHGWVYLHIHRRVYTHPQTGVHTHPQTGPNILTFGSNILTFGSNILTFGPNILTFGPKQGQNSSLLDQNRVKIAHFWVKIAHFGPKQLTFGSKQLTFGPKGCHQARLCTKRVSPGQIVHQKGVQRVYSHQKGVQRVYSHQKGVQPSKGCPDSQRVSRQSKRCPDSQKGVPTMGKGSRPWERVSRPREKPRTCACTYGTYPYCFWSTSGTPTRVHGPAATAAADVIHALTASVSPSGKWSLALDRELQHNGQLQGPETTVFRGKITYLNGQNHPSQSQITEQNRQKPLILVIFTENPLFRHFRPGVALFRVISPKNGDFNTMGGWRKPLKLG